MKKHNNLQMLMLVIGCVLIGFSSSLFSGNIPANYATLTKPFFSPPGYVFAPVWIVLYVMMGVSIYLVLKEREEHDVSKAVRFFIAQLVLNFFWSIIFFGWSNLSLAFYEILTLLVLIIFTIFSFHKVSKVAAYLLIPYALWVAFATLLTYSVWTLN
ncbi:MAG: tryptophan-rich sensory protein [Candidatus Pacebacteria bacterium]|nr:tryptophan-rich sensory protein [Candidatus Paceibacterota bacterium]